jgi:phage repressor protein C with HTH and peptisase S24 domain
MVGLVDARVDRAAQMLEEGAVKAVVDPGNGVVSVRGDSGLPGILPRSMIIIAYGDTYRTN